MAHPAGIDGDSTCGIWCGACSIARHGVSGHADAFVSALLKSVPAADVACGGCRSSLLWPGCRTCALRECAVTRGVDHCVACADYPCAAYRRWSAGSRLLPHVGESPGNLACIARQGVSGWSADQARRWSCPGCGTPFSWYQAACTGCGRSLESEAYSLTGLRRLIVRLLLPRLYRKGKA